MAGCDTVMKAEEREGDTCLYPEIISKCRMKFGIRAGEGDALAANGRLGGDAEVAENAGVCLKYCPGAPLTSSAISDSVPFFGIIFGP